MADRIRISLVIATYNRGSSLIRTLESVAAQDLPPSLWETVVVDNNCTDDTAALFAAFRDSHPGLNLRMVGETRQGLSPARNRGIAVAAGDLIAVIDDDQLVNTGYLRAYVEFFDAHPTAAGAGGIITPIYETAPPPWMSRYTERPIAGTLDLGGKVRRFPDGKYPGGGNMAVKRTEIEECGAFDPKLGRTGAALLGGEEKDLFRRIRQHGGEVWYVPGAVVYHIIPPGKTTPAYLLRLARMVGISEYRRTRHDGYAASLLAEAAKWCATMVLATLYTLALHPSKGRYLILMRRQISLGLLKGE